MKRLRLPEEAPAAIDALARVLLDRDGGRLSGIELVDRLRALAREFPDSVDIAAHLGGALFAQGAVQEARDVGDAALRLALDALVAAGWRADERRELSREPAENRPFWSAFEVAIFSAALLDDQRRVEELLALGRELAIDDVRWSLPYSDFRRQAILAAAADHDARFEELCDLDEQLGPLAHDSLIAILRTAPSVDSTENRTFAERLARRIAERVGGVAPDRIVVMRVGDVSWLGWRASDTATVLLGHASHLEWYWEDDYWQRRLRLVEWILDIRDGQRLNDDWWVWGERAHRIVSHPPAARQVWLDVGEAIAAGLGVSDDDLQPRPPAPPICVTVDDLEKCLASGSTGGVQVAGDVKPVGATLAQVQTIVADARSANAPPASRVCLRRVGDHLAYSIRAVGVVCARLDVRGCWVGAAPEHAVAMPASS